MRNKKVERTQHGMYRTPTHSSWYAMIERCKNPKNDWYHRYGGRGIVVCDRWLSFINFYSDMGKKPSKLHSLDRIDNDGNYEPNNCRWATKEQQDNNKEQTVFLEIGGVTKCITEWAAESGLMAHTIRQRLYRGYSPTDAVFKPKDQTRGMHLRRGYKPKK